MSAAEDPDEVVTPPRGSGSLQLAEIARELSDQALRSAFLRRKNPVTMKESDRLHVIADRLIELEARFLRLRQLDAALVSAERTLLVDEMVDLKQEMEDMRVIGPRAAESSER